MAITQEFMATCLAVPPSLYLVLGSRRKLQEGTGPAPLRGAAFPRRRDIASRIEPFLGTSVYFCSRAGCPMPRFLTTNRTSGKAYWFPPGFQTPLHISFGFPSAAPKGNIWSLCSAVIAAPRPPGSAGHPPAQWEPSRRGRSLWLLAGPGPDAEPRSPWGTSSTGMN